MGQGNIGSKLISTFLASLIISLGFVLSELYDYQSLSEVIAVVALVFSVSFAFICCIGIPTMYLRDKVSISINSTKKVLNLFYDLVFSIGITLISALIFTLIGWNVTRMSIVFGVLALLLLLVIEPYMARVEQKLKSMNYE